MPVQIDMEMPRSCGDCRFCRTEVFGCVYCDAYENYGKEISPCTKLQLFAGRKGWCPLVEAKEQKWHVVAEGDLPEEVGNYLVTVERTFFSGEYPRGRVVREVLQAYFKRDDSYIVGYVWWSDCAGLDDRDVLAWRELPEPWKGENKQCENG
ncbi:hypothetical protein [Eubacterium limosum]|uniref:hypothetical protein n=1 Tax=Eubacterium limosum TaxID=1736 RepID=UPI003713F94B